MAETAEPKKQPPVPRIIYGVHAVRPREVCATQFVTANFSAAEKYAKTVSRDPGVLAAAVTRHVVDAEGQHRPEALYVNGRRQEVPTCLMTGGLIRMAIRKRYATDY